MPQLLNPKTLLGIACDVVAREVAHLDDRRWDDWLALWTDDCEYWVPTWVTEDTLASDPHRELSHIYYANRTGLEDRIARIRTGRAPSANPLRRTSHSVSNILVTDPGDASFGFRTSWNAHVYDPHAKQSFQFFGHAEYRLALRPSGWLIARKKTILLNDTLPSMIDVYCI